MGGGASRDENVILFINVNKQVYIAGEVVEGQIYLQAKQNIAYSNICIKLIGQEHVCWTTGSGRSRTTHRDTYSNYNFHMLVFDFRNNVRQGGYCFPFSLVLPSAMSGSFFFSANCYIKYLLRVQLVHPTQNSKTQFHQIFLNIMEPPRIPIQPKTLTKTVNVKFCTCCCDYGYTSVTLNCSKNFLLNGEQFKISGKINNINGKTNVDKFTITLKEHRFMISGRGSRTNPIDNIYLLVSYPTQILAGTEHNFNYLATVPQNIVNYTAIGRSAARYFVLYLDAQLGCCMSAPSASIHLIIHSRTPIVFQKKQMQIPPNWSPKIYQRIMRQLPPFQNLSMGRMPHCNVFLNQQFQQEQMYYQQHQQFQYQQPQLQQSPQQMNQQGSQNNDQNLTDQVLKQFLNYQPTYYNQNMLTQEQQKQQGFRQQKPYFQHQDTNDNLTKK